MGSLNDLIDRTINFLNADITNRAKLGTLTSISFSGATLTGMSVLAVDGNSSHSGQALLEIGNSLVQVSNYDSNTGSTTLLPWGNGVNGTAPITSGTAPVNSKVTINPLWSRWSVGMHLIDAINNLYPQLYSVKQTTLTSSVSAERYALPTDAAGILKVQTEWYGSSTPRLPQKMWDFVPSSPEGVPQITMLTGVSGRPIRVWYKAKPVLPTSPNDTGWSWTTSLMPTSAEDLPVLQAVSTLAMAPEIAKQQTFSAEQSDRSRFVTVGAGSAASRRVREMYETRLAEEALKLRQLYPVRPHMSLRG